MLRSEADQGVQGSGFFSSSTMSWRDNFLNLPGPYFFSLKEKLFESVDHTLESWYSVALGTPAETTVHISMVSVYKSELQGCLGT